MRLKVIAVICATGLTSIASAGVIRDDKSDSDWEILVAPYLWGVSLDGTSEISGLPAEIDADFSDILSNLNVAASLHTEFHRGKWGFVFDPTYLSLEADIEVPTPGSSPKADIDIWLVEAWAAYKITPNWEVLGGARWQDQDIDVSDLPSPPLPIDSISGGDSWLDWFAGTRFNYPLGQRWNATARGDIAVAGDSERSVNIEVFVNRRFGTNMALNVGYRYFKDDYDDTPSYGWDIEQTGPVVGYTWAF